MHKIFILCLTGCSGIGSAPLQTVAYYENPGILMIVQSVDFEDSKLNFGGRNRKELQSEYLLSAPAINRRSRTNEKYRVRAHRRKINNFLLQIMICAFMMQCQSINDICRHGNSEA